MAALRQLGRKMGLVPALRQQLARTTRRLASTTTSQSSASHQGCRARVAAEAWDWKPLMDDVEIANRQHAKLMAEMDRRHAEFMAKCDAHLKAIEQDRRNERFLIGTVCTGAGMLLLFMWYRIYKEEQRVKYWRSKLLEL